jgi:hypothetical protein
VRHEIGKRPLCTGLAAPGVVALELVERVGVEEIELCRSA